MDLTFSRKKYIKAVLIQAYLDNMEYFGRLFIKAKQTIDHLEGQEFANAWEEMKSDYQRKCADDAINMLVQQYPDSADRATQYYQDRVVRGLDGHIVVLVKYMDPAYTCCVLYYILTGKKYSELFRYHANVAESEIKLMMKTWLRMWENNYAHNEPLFMGEGNPHMEY